MKGYGFLSFAKSMGKTTGKNMSKILSGKYSQKVLIMLNNLQQMHLKIAQKNNSEKKKKESRNNW